MIKRSVFVFFYAHEASTAKLFTTPIQGSPNVAVETSMLQVLDPTQACNVYKLLTKTV